MRIAEIFSADQIEEMIVSLLEKEVECKDYDTSIGYLKSIEKLDAASNALERNIRYDA